jgi:uncharacterized protein (TIGR02145 family)
MKKVILLLWALAALVGCSDHEQPGNGYSNLAVELSGSIIEAGVTRSDGVIEGTSPSKELQIDVFRKDQSGGVYQDAVWDLKVLGRLKTDGTIGLTPTQFFLTPNTNDSRFIGVYPVGDAYDKSARTVTYTELDGAMDVAVSDFAEGNEGTGNGPVYVNNDKTLLFQHLLTKIVVKLQAKDDDPGKVKEIINTWGKVSSITVKDKKTGAVVTLPAANAADATGVSIAATGATADLPLTTPTGGTPPAALLTTEATPFGYAMFLPVKSAGALTLDINFENSHNPTQTVDIAPQTYEAGKGYSITVVFGAIALVGTTSGFIGWDESTTAIEKKKNVHTITPQPYTETPDGMTNAYIVAPDEVLKFKVARAYKYESGNFTDNLRATDATYTGEFTAEVLWSDAAVIDGNVAVVGSGADAVVSLKTTATAGNAVVAIKKKDTDDIVWSYHIWVTAYVPETENTTSQASGLTFMSRNLGALADDLSTAAYGLYYQWGRKDPFPGVDNPGGVDGAITLTDTSSEVGTVTYSIQHPATFIFASASPNDWHHGSRNDALWGQGDDKSVYDPCPSGWRVPQFTTLDEAGSPWKGFTKDNGAWVSDGGGRDWSNADDLLSPQQYGSYPAAGYRSPTSGAFDNTGSYGFAWSSAVTSAFGYNLYFNSTGVYPSNIYNRAFGFSVRCVSE